MEEKVYWFITVIEKIEPSDNYFANVGSSRCWGFFCNKQDALDTLHNKIEEITDSKAELMGNLEDLSKMDRYTQIMELGSLLSEELYTEKMKAQAEEKEKSTQLSIEFDERVGDATDELKINPDRTGVKLEKQSSALNIKVMDRSGEAVGRVTE